MSVRSFQQIVDDAERQRLLAAADSARDARIIRHREERRQADTNKMRAAVAMLVTRGWSWDGKTWKFG